MENVSSKSCSRKKRRRNKRRAHSQKFRETSKHSVKRVKMDISNNSVGNKWFWENYRKINSWHTRHKLAYWKSLAVSYKDENEYLVRVIQSLNPDYPKLIEDMKYDTKKYDDDLEESDSSIKSNEDNCSFELGREMVEWCKQKLIHEAALKKEREETERAEKNNENQLLPEVAFRERIREMGELYGEASAKIIGMETAMQLNYDRLMDRYKPIYWPNIPLKF